MSKYRAKRKEAQRSEDSIEDHFPQEVSAGSRTEMRDRISSTFHSLIELGEERVNNEGQGTSQSRNLYKPTPILWVKKFLKSYILGVRAGELGIHHLHRN